MSRISKIGGDFSSSSVADKRFLVHIFADDRRFYCQKAMFCYAFLAVFSFFVMTLLIVFLWWLGHSLLFGFVCVLLGITWVLVALLLLGLIEKNFVRMRDSSRLFSEGLLELYPGRMGGNN